ncbi:MAG: hypothetical protein J0H31_18780 [Alphaproteobacteria bacterium]|nr:hypothetical protein [Alphaproteobacteria bacterium]
MAYVFATPNVGMPAIAATLAADQAGRVPWKLGDIVRAVDPTYGAGEFIYLKGAANTAIGSWVTYNADDNSTTLLAANAIGPVAVAMSANVANQYGWYQIGGKAIGLCMAGYVDDANVYAPPTAGSVDDAVVAGDRVKNAKGASAIGTPSGSFAEFEIARPFMDDALAA